MPRCPLYLLLVLSAVLPTASFSQAVDADSQIAGAVLAAPVDLRDGARVLGYDGTGMLIELRKGVNELTCIADQENNEQFHVACYHNALEPYMARGRELRQQGITGQESLDIRHSEADDGVLQMPAEPAAVYNIHTETTSLNPEAASATLYAVYIPYATQASTGIPENVSGAGVPWIMRAGTASAHIMILPPNQ